MRKHILLSFVAAALFLSACGETIRIVTAKKWLTTGETTAFYVAYWEGSCSVAGGNAANCSTGYSRIKQCKLIIDENVLACRESEEASKALNPE